MKAADFRVSIKETWLHRAGAAAILIFSFIIYLRTMAPTLSFWDCGEFIACASILGIAHPPGSPLYIFIGRLFTLIPTFADISARLNLFSVLAGAFTAMMTFLVTFRLIRYWWSPEKFAGWPKLIAYVGAVVGTFMVAFGKTHWNNTLESEVYTPSMLILMMILWLLLQWIDQRDGPRGDRYLIAINFLGFLSTGIHMTVFLFMPAIFLIIILVSEKFRRDYRFYITGVCLFLIAFDLDIFLWANMLWLVALVIGTFTSRDYLWKFSLALVLTMVVGFSVQLYTPIRSAQDPMINQNDPSESYSAFRNFLERRQYNQENMILRALERRGEPRNQFGTYPRMGFWRFFSDQYGVAGRSFSFLFVIGMYGIYYLSKKRYKLGVPFFIMILLGTLALVWYMNFADGTHQDPITGEGHIEVRDRDYFFTPGFVLFGMAIGMGVSGLLALVREALPGANKLSGALTGIGTVAVLMAAMPIMVNYGEVDRSKNYIPYDFAKNLLKSCDYNSILFIAGDNDTFPLWSMQEAYCLRPDLTAINLSLANMGWYIKQVRDYMGVPLGWNDQEIAGLRHGRTSSGRMYRIADQLTDRVLDVMAGKKTIQYAITVGTELQQYKMQSLRDNLVMKGMVYELDFSEHPGTINMDEHRRLIEDYFDYRSLSDASIPVDERTVALTGNYATGFVLLADSLRMLGQYDEAIALTLDCLKKLPFQYSTYNFLTQLYVDAGMEDKIPEILDKVPQNKVADIYFVWGLANSYKGNREKAKSLFKANLDSFPGHKDTFWEYARLLYQDSQFVELQDAAQNYIRANPSDKDAEALLRDVARKAYSNDQGN